MKRKGFTLVEILIIIVVIGILASMMTLSSTEAVTTAKATSIINNLYTIRKATLAWYTDHREIVRYLNRNRTNIQWANQNDALGITKYIDNNSREFVINDYKPDYHFSNSKLPTGKYGIMNVEWYRRAWYAGYIFADGEEAVKEKVKLRAHSMGLIFSGRYPNPGLVDLTLTSDDRDVEGDEAVWLFVLGDFHQTDKDWSNNSVGSLKEDWQNIFPSDWESRMPK